MRRRFVLITTVVVLLITLLAGCTAPSSKDSTKASQGTPETGFSLTVTQPADNSLSNTERIEVRGHTNPGAVVSADQVITRADDQGNFTMTVRLEEGLNVIEVVASDETGNEATVNLTMTLLKGG